MGFNKFILSSESLIFNINKIRNIVGDNVKICAVIKADAYGHGAIWTAKTLSKYCDYFAVANISEAMDLRNSNIKNNILILGLLSKSDILYCLNNNISINISSNAQLTDLIYILNTSNLLPDNRLHIHLKINTGMNRLGYDSLDEFKEAIHIISKNKYLVLDGVFTHFATKSGDVDYIFSQHQDFLRYLNFVNEKCINIHCASSYATLNFDELHHSMVRVGYLLYGWENGFKNVLSISSEIVHINDIKDGTVGYDRTYSCWDRKIGVIPLGYADGFDRRLSNNFSVLVNGQFAPVVGYICMDMFMVDVTDIPGVQVGSKVTILGSCGSNSVTVYDYAKALGTSPYDALLKFRKNRMDIIEI